MSQPSAAREAHLQPPFDLPPSAYSPAEVTVLPTPPLTSSSSSDQRSTPNVVNFVTDHELRRAADWFNDLSDLGPIVKVTFTSWSPRFMIPCMHLCYTCCKGVCNNFIRNNIVDYLFPGDIDGSYRDHFFCAWCYFPLYFLENVTM